MFRETKLPAVRAISPFVTRSLMCFSKLCLGLMVLLTMGGCAHNGDSKGESNSILPFFSNTPLEASLINARIDGQTDQLSEMAEQLEHLSGMVAQLKTQVADEKAQVQVPILTNTALAIVPEKTEQDEIPVDQDDVSAAEKPNHKAIVGAVEWVWADSLNTHMKARIDTGAALSSLNAVDVKIYEKDGKRWTRFTVLAEDNDTRRLLQKKSRDDSKEGSQKADKEELLWVIDTPIERFVRIRQVVSEKVERRPVVRLPIRLGPIQEMTEFTLSNRQQMEFPMLLGRSFLQDLAVVDVSERYLMKKQWISKQVRRSDVDLSRVPSVKVDQ